MEEVLDENTSSTRVDKSRKGDKKVMNAWAFYDWANSVYPLVITTAIFPMFYKAVYPDDLTFLGVEIDSTALINFVTSFYFLLIVLAMPMLTGMADAGGNKKRFLRTFAYIGSISCTTLYFFDAENRIYLSFLSYMLAGIGFWSSLVFYNAYLPEIAAKEDQDRLSAKGFSMGYIGSVILLIVCLVLIQVLGRPPQEAFLLTGIWWFGFSHVTFRYLNDQKREKEKTNKEIIKSGYKEIQKVFREVRKTDFLKKYLSSFFVYSMAVQTIMMVAVYFAEEEVNWPDDDTKTLGLIVSIILIQLIAIPGAMIMARMSKKYGNFATLRVIIGLWVLICGAAYLLHEPVEFYVLAGFVGFVMGATQSLSRSTYSKLVPKDTVDTSSYFSFYDISEKLGIVIGMAVYAGFEVLTGEMRNSVLALIAFFVVGLILLFRLPKRTEEFSN